MVTVPRLETSVFDELCRKSYSTPGFCWRSWGVWEAPGRLRVPGRFREGSGGLREPLGGSGRLWEALRGSGRIVFGIVGERGGPK